MPTPKQARFVAEYLVDLNATQAAIRAGYSAKTAKAQGARLLTNVDVQAAIQQARDERAKRTEITADRVLKELAHIGFANLGDFIRLVGGEPAIDLSGMTRDQAAALSEVVTEDFVIGRGDDARDVRRVKVKLHDKLGALEKLGKHLGMFITTKHELSGPNGAPIRHDVRDVSQMSDAELQALAGDDD